MIELEKIVREFRAAMGQPVDTKPENVKEDDARLCASLIGEETIEVFLALQDFLVDPTDPQNRADLVEELADLLYVTAGAAVWAGLPVEEALRRKHASNMSKLDDNGQPIRDPATGKVLKGPNYKPPSLLDLVA